ncbi:MAG: aminoacyl-tRNA hydrolase [Armatimonadetes bacterium]|nr:aminoacyl-tRNA hydrolase [Armatimonadota bacterium]
MHCLVGLGNPGAQYAETRHNVGFLVIDRLAARHQIGVTRGRHRALYGRGKIDGEDCLLVKPQTFMNDSGDAVLRVLLYYRLQPEDVLLIYDDIALDLAVMRLRRGGSDGGHKGVRSVIHYLDTNQIARLRLGVGVPPAGVSAVNYVLSPFARSEQERAREMVEFGADAVEVCVREGLEVAMNRFNS